MALLHTTVNPDDTTLVLDQHVSWQIGDEIAISSTSYDGNHSEKVKITAISNSHTATESLITFEPALKYKHISAIETYGDNNKHLVMKAEVVLLTSNVVIQGEK